MYRYQFKINAFVNLHYCFTWVPSKNFKFLFYISAKYNSIFYSRSYIRYAPLYNSWCLDSAPSGWVPLILKVFPRRKNGTCVFISLTFKLQQLSRGGSFLFPLVLCLSGTLLLWSSNFLRAKVIIINRFSLLNFWENYIFENI